MLNVRELPPTRVSIDAVTPSGQHKRWAMDEPKAENVPSDLTWASTMPGGYEQFECKLARDPEKDYGDLERLSTLYIKGAGGEPVGEYRIESTPRESGRERSVNVKGVGWQAHLEDDETASEIFVDQSTSNWEGPGVARKIAATASYNVTDPTTTIDPTSGQPSLQLTNTGPWGTFPSSVLSEGWYDAGSVPIGSVYYAWKRGTNTSAASAWTWQVQLSTDDILTATDSTGNLIAAGPGANTLTATTSTKRFAVVQFAFANTANAVQSEYDIFWTRLAVYGTHGLTKQGTESATSAKGFFASDVIANCISRWAPLLNFTTGSNGSIKPTSFVIPQLEFRDPTTASEMMKAANKFHLRDWAVWDNKTFYYHDRGDRGRRWRARVAPAQLEETGPQVERLWNGVIVQWRDVDGTAKTVGPTGSGALATSADLLDTDPLNPANQLGIRRYTKLDMGIVSTLAAATEVGKRFLAESKLLDSSGQATLVGHVQDDRGITRPANQVKAGDYITFVDASDSSPRRIVKASHEYGSRTTTIDLDAPPEGMDALLERLGVVLIPLGVT